MLELNCLHSFASRFFRILLFASETDPFSGVYESVTGDEPVDAADGLPNELYVKLAVELANELLAELARVFEPMFCSDWPIDKLDSLFSDRPLGDAKRSALGLASGAWPTVDELQANRMCSMVGLGKMNTLLHFVQ